MQTVLINGVGVNIDSKDIQNCKSLEDIEKLDLFSHMNNEDKAISEQGLFEKLGLNIPKSQWDTFN